MKKHIALFIALIFALCSFSVPFCLTQIDSVSALSSAVDITSFPDVQYANGVNIAEYESVIESLQQNESISDLGDCYILINVGNRCEFYIFKDFTQLRTVFDGYYGVNADCYIPSKYGKFENIDKFMVSSYQFELSEFAYDTGRVLGVLPPSAVSFPYMPLGLNQSDQIYDHSPNVYCFYSSVTPPYNPSSNNNLSLGIDEDGFYNWLIETTKDSNFTPYLPLNRLFQYLQYYDAWGSTPQKFLMLYNIEYGDTIGTHLNNMQIIELKNLTDRLYREYLDSLKYPPADFPARHRVDIRKDIDTNTTDNNTVLITDDSNDTVLISILRDILRGVIAIRNQVYVTGTDIITGLDNLDFTVNVANNGGDFPELDLSPLYTYDSDDFNDDLNGFAEDVAELQQLPLSYVTNINNNSLMPENMLSDKDNLSVNIPNISGFTVSDNGSAYSTQTTTYNLKSSDYPWLDTMVKKIKRFASILLIIGYLVHLRFKIPELVRGE